MQLIAQAIGFIAFFISLTAFHRKKKEKILASMVLSNTLNLVHYFLLGAYSGSITKIMAIFRDSFIILKKKYIKLNSKIFFFLFIIAYILITIFTYDSFYTIFPLLAATFYFIPIWNGTESTIRISAFITTFFWLIYNIIVFSIPGILSNIATISSTFVAILNSKKDNKITYINDVKDTIKK